MEGLTPGLVYKFGIQAFTKAGIGGMTLQPKVRTPCTETTSPHTRAHSSHLFPPTHTHYPQQQYIVDGIYFPMGVPDNPSQVGIVGMGTGAIKVQWEAPEPDGGASIKNYRITATPLNTGKLTLRQKKPVVVVCNAEDPAPQCESDFILMVGSTKKAGGVKTGLQIQNGTSPICGGAGKRGGGKVHV